MKQLKEMVQWRTSSGQTIATGDITVTPQLRTLVVRWPYGGWAWSRPVAVQVRRQDQPEASPTHLPIVDVTRLAQLALWGLALIFSTMTLFLTIQQRRSQRE